MQNVNSKYRLAFSQSLFISLSPSLHWHYPRNSYCIYLSILLSVIRIGEISSLWDSFKNLGHILRVYLVFGKKLILLWQKCFTLGHIFIAKYYKIIYPSGHSDLALSLSVSILLYLSLSILPYLYLHLFTYTILRTAIVSLSYSIYLSYSFSLHDFSYTILRTVIVSLSLSLSLSLSWQQNNKVFLHLKV